MQDLQSGIDIRDVPLERVGIKHLRLPIRIQEKSGSLQHVVASAGLFVEVPANVRGTHLSRFVSLLNEWVNQPVSSADIQSLLAEARSRAHSFSAEVALAFEYFLPRSAPVSGKVGVVDYGCEFNGRLSEESYDFRLGVSVPITTLCPCSKAISRVGAHNQRAMVRVSIRYEPDTFIWLEDLISLVESQASCPVLPVLKREDEKYVTEAAYDNPKFVEDVVRDIVLAIGNVPGVTWLSAECESFESIHNHNAYAGAEQLLLDNEQGARGSSPLSQLGEKHG
jgi:GTP cyclohydrolase I